MPRKLDELNARRTAVLNAQIAAMQELLRTSSDPFRASILLNTVIDTAVENREIGREIDAKIDAQIANMRKPWIRRVFG